MAYENLLRSVEESAEEKERILREKTRRQIREILDEAHARADAIENGLALEAEKKVGIEKNKEKYLAGAAIKLEIIRLKETCLNRAFTEAHKNLAGIRDDARYPEVFKKLAVESLAALDSASPCIHIDKRDELLCRTVMGELAPGATIIPDLNCTGGLVITSPDGTFAISNTIESRLERAKERLSRELHNILAGA